MKAGTVLVTTFEEYEVLEQIGSGGAGDVVKATKSDGHPVAIKALRPNQPKIKLNRFRNEMQFCMASGHSNIIQVLDRGIHEAKSGNQPFYVMPLYESTLRKEIAAGRIAGQELEIFSQIMDGIEAAHLQKTIHRDLKPENILINPSKRELVVADFGIAHFEEDNLIHTVETEAGDRLASWEYAAPEQRRPGQTVDLRADIYSLGMILVELFTGKAPHGTDPQTIESISPEHGFLDELANAMRQNLPERRPQSIEAVKSHMIARHQNFVSWQKLDELNRTVIPSSSVSDDLINNPIRLEHVDYRGGALYFTLSGTPNTQWINHFRNMGNYGGVMGSEPRAFNFTGNMANVPTREQTAQWVVDHFKNCLTNTNQAYSNAIRTAIAQNEERRRAELQRQIDEKQRELETSRRVNSQLRW